MSYPLSLELQPKQEQKQMQRLMMTPQMQQAIQFLQLPVMELSQTVEQEMEQNPLLEYMDEEEEAPTAEDEKGLKEEKEIEFDEHQLDVLRHLDEDFREYLTDSDQFVPRRSQEEDKRKAFLESSIQEEPSLWDHLMSQAREAFDDKEQLHIAETVIGYLDENGFLSTPLEEIASFLALDVQKIQAVATVIKTFDPIGVGAENVREVLLMQLKFQGKQETLAYKIIDKHYDDLVHNRLPVIHKALHLPLSEIQETIQHEIAHLDLHPGSSFAHVESSTRIPDVRLRLEGEEYVAEVSEGQLQPLRLNRKYMKMLDDESIPQETKDFIKAKILSAKWLMKNLHQRGETLHKIANALCQHHKNFFASPEGKLTPLTMKNLAEELSLHESTIARAVANKYLETPRGLFAFRYFFSSGYVDEQGEDVSSKTIREQIIQYINEENKLKPLSDEALSKKISATGVRCARRTVAKYRLELKIGNTQQRRKY